PCNMFVAGFIGSPQMNFINAVVGQEGDGNVLSFADTKVKSDKAALADYVGKEVVLGVRPEDIHAEPEMIAANPDATLEVDVNLAEMMGSEIYLYMDYADCKMISRVPSKFAIKTDDRATLVIDENCIHIFDKDTEEVI
ncbi:MAG: TOBE domain-containing protein, partial [Eubacterium sp.]|nr:TOBE domain-containing protein [Candidatus Colimonas fimequi]